jgi:hypothetical protein
MGFYVDPRKDTLDNLRTPVWNVHPRRHSPNFLTRRLDSLVLTLCSLNFWCSEAPSSFSLLTYLTMGFGNLIREWEKRKQNSFFIFFSVKSYLSTFSRRMRICCVTTIRAAILEIWLYWKRKNVKKISFVVTSFTYRIHIFYFPVVFLYAYRETSHRSFYLKKLKFSAKTLKIILFSAKMTLFS